MSKADKIWKSIPNYETNYEISNYGEVRNIKTKRILKPCINNKGYLMVGLSKECKTKLFTIHKLMAITFFENYSDKLVVNHINGIKTDNRIENLELITQKNNIIKAWEQGLCENIRNNAYNKIHKRKIKTSKAVAQYDLKGNLVNKFVSIREAEEKTGINNCLIVGVCKGRKNTTHNFVFKYI